MGSCHFLSGWHCSPSSTACARATGSPEPASLGSFPLFFGQHEGPLLCSVSGGRAWQPHRSPARLVTAAAWQLRQGLGGSEPNRTELNRTGLGRAGAGAPGRHGMSLPLAWAWRRRPCDPPPACLPLRRGWEWGHETCLCSFKEPSRIPHCHHPPPLPPCRLPEGRADYSSAIVQVTYKWICMEAGWEGQRGGIY